jgi:hypothetical protein
MPSGHAQFVCYSVSFVYYCTRSNSRLIGMSLLSLRATRQRIVTQMHTFGQVMVGAALGLIMGVVMADGGAKRTIQGLFEVKRHLQAPSSPGIFL